MDHIFPHEKVFFCKEILSLEFELFNEYKMRMNLPPLFSISLKDVKNGKLKNQIQQLIHRSKNSQLICCKKSSTGKIIFKKSRSYVLQPLIDCCLKGL